MARKSYSAFFVLRRVLTSPMIPLRSNCDSFNAQHRCSALGPSAIGHFTLVATTSLVILPITLSANFQPLLGSHSWRRKWHPTPVFLPGKSHEQRSLVGYSPWGHKESDTTEWLHFTWAHRTFQSPSTQHRYQGSWIKLPSGCPSA